MRKKLTALLVLLLALLPVLTSAAGAASESRINAYTMKAVSLDSGVVGIEFDVSAPRTMKAIGAQIDIYSGTTLLRSRTHTGRGKFAFGLTSREYLVPGGRYYIEITVFARNYSGQEDRRTEGFYVTA